MNVVLKRYSWFILKILILGLTVFYLYKALTGNENSYNNWLSLLQQQDRPETWILISFSVILVLFNWGLEAWKWKQLASKIFQISFWKAFRSVMVGLTLGFITPNRVGDYAGRILDLNSPKRLEALGAVFLGRFAQLIITVITGFLGCYYITWSFYLSGFFWAKIGIGMLVLTVIISALLFYYNSRLIISLILLIKPLRKFLVYIRILARYSKKELGIILLLAGLRYMVFCLQFGLLLTAFGVKLSFIQYLAGISGTFLLKSIVPSLSALTDIGLRELSAMHFFQLFGQQPSMGSCSCSFGWRGSAALPK